MSQNSDPQFDVLKQNIIKAKKYIHSLSKQFLENNVNFDTNFDDDKKTVLKDSLVKLLNMEDQIQLQLNAFNQLQFEAHDSFEKISHDEDVDHIMKSIDLEVKYNSILENISNQSSFDALNSDDYTNLLNMLSDHAQTADNEDVEMLQTDFEIPIDPISKLEISDPVRNKICKHLYDKSNFVKLIQQNRTIKCPVTGCSNKKVTIDDVEDDSRTKIFIDKARRQQEE